MVTTRVVAHDYAGRCILAYVSLLLIYFARSTRLGPAEPRLAHAKFAGMVPTCQALPTSKAGVLRVKITLVPIQPAVRRAARSTSFRFAVAVAEATYR